MEHVWLCAWVPGFQLAVASASKVSTGRCEGCVDHPELAHSELVLSADENVGGSTTRVATTQMPVNSTEQLQETSHPSRQTVPAGLCLVSRSLQEQGISEPAEELDINGWRLSTIHASLLEEMEAVLRWTGL